MIKTKILLLSLLGLSFYGKAQVDNFTGTANAVVPLFNYSLDGLHLGVSISYSTKGIKVDDIAGLIGLGWTMNASSFIQRDMRGIEDDISQYPGNAVGGGYWVKYGTGTFTIPGDTGDYEPDVFTANLGGRSIRFSLIPTGDTALQPFYKVITYPKSSIKVQLYYDGVEQTNYLPDTVAKHEDGITFVITDERGNKFEFEPADYKVVENTPFRKAIQKWLVKKITTSTGLEVLHSVETPMPRRLMVAPFIKTMVSPTAKWMAGCRDIYGVGQVTMPYRMHTVILTIRPGD